MRQCPTQAILRNAEFCEDQMGMSVGLLENTRWLR